jgi:cation transport ATPase
VDGVIIEAHPADEAVITGESRRSKGGGSAVIAGSINVEGYC